ncbi:MAG: alginate export family protein [Bryobacterales bacterium]|nr:alginate export family protein [Bryobacterales bacterium]
MQRVPLVLTAGLLLGTVTAAADATFGLPSWLTAGAEIRGRMEGFNHIRFDPSRSDDYYLHRLRLNLGIQAAPWLRFFVQGQDARALGYDNPVPSTVADSFDLRQGYFELGDTGKGRVGLRAGRQELAFGEERLVGATDWGNVARTFDAVRLSWQQPGMRLDGFASSVVVPVQGKFDRPHFNNKFHGVYSSFDRMVPEGVWQSYLFLKTTSHAIGELGHGGNARVYTFGLHGKGKLPRRFDYNLETAAQAGHVSGDPVHAWASFARLGYTTGTAARAPRVVIEYNHATGDKNPKDGRAGTFDQLYPTNHYRYGIADQVGWRNMHDATGGIEWNLQPKWRLNADYHSFWLDSRADALYAAGGAPVVRNPAATSSHVGNELDTYVNYIHSKRLKFTGGVGYLFAGEYLKQSTKGANLLAPYLMWTYTL